MTDNYTGSQAQLEHLVRARAIGMEKRAIKRKEYLDQLLKNNRYLSWSLENQHISKISLTMLFMAEGSKRQKGSLMFGNSDPGIIALFLHLFRFCYMIDEDKFRCTVQCRADQDIASLEHFWSGVTKIPLNKFLKAQVDKRSIGKPTKKKDYRGVCRIEYYSAYIFHDLMQASKAIIEGL